MRLWPEARCVPRRPAGVHADGGGRARNVHLLPIRHRPCRHPHRHLRPPPVARVGRRCRAHRREGARHRGHHHHFGSGRRQRQASRRAALRLQPPHAPRRGWHRQCAREARRLGVVQPWPPIGGALPDPAAAADPRPRGGPTPHVVDAGAERRGRVPRGDDVPGAVPTPVQPAVRRARRRGDPRGGRRADERILRDVHVASGQELGLRLLPHEPSTGVQRPVLEAGEHRGR